MHMTEDEIKTLYHRAQSRKRQVKILAQLNAVTEWEMATWLIEHGEKVEIRKRWMLGEKK